MRALLIAAALMLGGCGGEASDSHRFERKTFERTQPGVTIVVHRTVDELRRAAPKRTVDAGKVDLMAWAVIRDGGCEVHVVDPAVTWKPEWLGHEVAHCVWGEWHR